MTPEMHRPVALDRIGPNGTEVAIEARPEELPRLAGRMGLPGIGALRCGFRLRRVGGAVIEAEGLLEARVTQVCVVTLDEFESDVADEFTLHFVPEGTEDDTPEPDAVDQVPYSGSAIDLGEAAAEQLALALDPYPRRPGAELPGDAAEPTPNPFAALSALREKE